MEIMQLFLFDVTNKELQNVDFSTARLNKKMKNKNWN